MIERYVDIDFDNRISYEAEGGFDNEHDATIIRLKVIDENAKYYLDLGLFSGGFNKYRTEALPIENGYAIYSLPRDLTHGHLHVQGVMKIGDICRKTATITMRLGGSINALDELPESQPGWADSVDERIDGLEMGMKDAVTYTPQTLTEEQQERARVNIGAFPERVIKQFWSNDHSVADIRDITTRTGYNFISYRGDDCNLNGVIINKEIVFPCLVLSVENYTDQVRNLVILDGAGRTLDMTIHNIHGVVGYHWHDPILRTWTDEQESI